MVESLLQQSWLHADLMTSQFFLMEPMFSAATILQIWEAQEAVPCQLSVAGDTNLPVLYIVLAVLRFVVFSCLANHIILVQFSTSFLLVFALL